MNRSEDTQAEAEARAFENGYHTGWRDALTQYPNWTDEDARRAAIEFGLIEETP